MVPCKKIKKKVILSFFSLSFKDERFYSRDLILRLLVFTSFKAVY